MTDTYTYEDGEGYDGREYKRWNKLALPLYLYAGRAYVDGDGKIVTPNYVNRDEGGNRYGYPSKVAPTPQHHRQISGLLADKVTFENLGQLDQESFLPKATIEYGGIGDTVNNQGLNAMLKIFDDHLVLAETAPRQYWYFKEEIISGFPASVTGERWGIINAYAYKWANPGVVASPTVDAFEAESPTEYARFKASTPHWWDDQFLYNQNDMADMDVIDTIVGKESHALLRRLPYSIFWLFVDPFPFHFPEDGIPPQQGWIRVYDYEWNLVQRKPRRTDTFIKKWD